MTRFPVWLNADRNAIVIFDDAITLDEWATVEVVIRSYIALLRKRVDKRTRATGGGDRGE